MQKYEADHWEVERNRVTICEELGRGAFGKVHRGTYDDPERGIVECAIKTVKDGAPHIECIQFLREAHTMKYVAPLVYEWCFDLQDLAIKLFY